MRILCPGCKGMIFFSGGDFIGNEFHHTSCRRASCLILGPRPLENPASNSRYVLLVSCVLCPRDGRDQFGLEPAVFQGKPQFLPFEVLSSKYVLIELTIATLHAACFQTVHGTRQSGAGELIET